MAQSSNEVQDFSVAPGLTLELIASEPLTKWPMLVDWDENGHLLVVESGGVAHPIQQHNQQALHRLVRLIDDDGDGKMDRREIVADGLPFTEGVLCLGDRILISAPPYIYQLLDRDANGSCETKDIWFDGQTITGCANDLHGPYLGRDGWVYWSKGAFAHQTHETLGGGVISDKAAHLFRRRIAGGPIEPLMSGGMDNPVGFAMLPNGERFFSSTFLVHPGDGMRDGVVHAIYGGVYGKDHSALDGIARTGPLMPITVHLGPAAPSGMICLRTDAVLPHSDPLLTVALFNHRKVVALPLSAQGTSYLTEPVDILVGHRIDFHPTDVIEDSDGSLLVIDTGGWYDLCCPSSRVDQQLAPGGIYRLRNESSPRSKDARLRQIDFSSLSESQAVELLESPQPWIARRALLRIAASGDWAVPGLMRQVRNEDLPMATRRNALWALGATGTDTSLDFISTTLSANLAPERWTASTLQETIDDDLDHVACHLLSLHRYQPARKVLHQIVSNSFISGHPANAPAVPSTANQFSDDPAAASGADISYKARPALLRVCIEALGRLGDEETVDWLFSAFPQIGQDRMLDHSIRYAVYEIGKPEAIARYLNSSNPQQRELALSTLHLLDDETHLTADLLIATAQDAGTMQAAIHILAERPDVSAQLLSTLGPKWTAQLANHPPSELARAMCQSWSGEQSLIDWIGTTFESAIQPSSDSRPPITEATWEWIELAVASRKGQSLPKTWHNWVIRSMEIDLPRTAGLLIHINLNSPDQTPIVDSLSERISQQSDIETRESLLLSLPPRHQFTDDEVLLRQLDTLHDQPDNRRAWDILKRLAFPVERAHQLYEVCTRLATSELLLSIEIIASEGSDALNQRLLEDLVENRRARALPPGSLKSIYRRRNDELQALAERVDQILTEGDPDVKAHIQSVLLQLPEGDPVRGLSIFHSSKTNCITCHQMGYLGGNIGPELTRIGKSRTREALVEAILFPNQRIEQGFQATQVVTVDGRVMHGLPTGNSSDLLLELRVSADKLEIVPRQEVEQLLPSDISIMPSGMFELLSLQELADLVSLLEAAQ